VVDHDICEDGTMCSNGKFLVLIRATLTEPLCAESRFLAELSFSDKKRKMSNSIPP
jgi:hypothetical protein